MGFHGPSTRFTVIGWIIKENYPASHESDESRRESGKSLANYPSVNQFSSILTGSFSFCSRRAHTFGCLVAMVRAWDFMGGPASTRRRQTVCKPGSVLGPRADGWPFLWDARCRTPRATNPDGGRERPSRPPGFPWHRARPYSVLLPVGFTVPRPSPAARCALTAPFHPCPWAVAGGAGGLLSVALSLGSPPPGVTRHRVPVEPGLSSPGIAVTMPGAAIRPSGGPENRRTHGGLQGTETPLFLSGNPAAPI